VGVVADVRHRTLAEPPLPRVYDLLGQHWERTLFLVARGVPGAPPPLATSIRRAVASVDPEAPVFEPATLDELVAKSAAPHQLSTVVAAGLALTGVLLALAGVYATTAVGVSERRHELGVRAALGASPQEVFWLVLGDSAATVAVGSGVGVIAAVAVSQLLRSRVFGVAGVDLAWLVPLCAAALVAVGVLAAIAPARQAAAADPLESIRE
jgi:cell division protein FtsX